MSPASDDQRTGGAPPRRPHLRSSADRAERRWTLGDAQALRRLAPVSPQGELRWHRRTVESFGLTHRVTVPWQAGDVPPSVVDTVSDLLTGWWTARTGALAPGVTVTSVATALLPGPRTHRLALIVTTDQVAEATDVASPTMDRDLRRALRLAGQTEPPAAPGAPLSVVRPS